MLNETPSERYSRLLQRSYIPIGTAPHSEPVVQASRQEDFSLVARDGDNPRVLIYGIDHPQGQITQQERVLRLLSTIVDSGDIIGIEGVRGEIDMKRANQSSLYGLINQAISPRQARVILNDDPRLVARGVQLYQQLEAAVSDDQRDPLASTLMNHMRQRDLSMLSDEGFGIIPFITGTSSNHIPLAQDNKMIQIVGRMHVAMGNLESSLRDAGIGYRLFVPSEYAHDYKIREITDAPDMRAIAQEWVAIQGELGYVGFKTGITQELDARFGHDGWYRAWMLNGQVITQTDILGEYEEAYFKFLRDNSSTLDWLTSTATEAYDIDPTNVQSGTNWSKQECGAVHYQDIAIRRALKRLNRRFEGDHLVQVRGRESEGYRLNPGQVPYHRPDMILPRAEKTWWLPDSVEALYQNNKVLLVDPSRLILRPEIEGPEGTYFVQDKGTYYLCQGNAQRLTKHQGRLVRRRAQEER